MFDWKAFIGLILLIRDSRQAFQWIPNSSPQLFQDYYSRQLDRQLRVMKPPQETFASEFTPTFKSIRLTPNVDPWSLTYATDEGVNLKHLGSSSSNVGLTSGLVHFKPVVDFKKPKSQTFYKAVLVPHHSPVYEFRYKVHDPKEENYQEKSETRIGDSVRGYYSVREPNGYVRLVKYVSDENGFQTQVSHHHVDDKAEVGGGSNLFTMTRHIT